MRSGRNRRWNDRSAEPRWRKRGKRRGSNDWLTDRPVVGAVIADPLHVDPDLPDGHPDGRLDAPPSEGRDRAAAVQAAVEAAAAALQAEADQGIALSIE